MAQQETRSIRPWFAASSLSSLRQEMNDLFESFFGESGEASSASEPKVDISETDTTVELKADLPGFKPGEIHIDIRDNVLTVSGEHVEQKVETDRGRRYHRIERRRGSFSRSVYLPCSVKQQEVDAVLQDGVLTVTMRKSEEAKSTRIPVKGEPVQTPATPVSPPSAVETAG